MLFGSMALMLVPAAALANDIERRITRTLAREGWTDIQVSRTFLGRLRITARKRDARREIIVNPRTGEILRDLLVYGSGSVGSVLTDSRDDDGFSGGRGKDRDDDRDDDDRDDRDRDDRDRDDDDDSGGGDDDSDDSDDGDDGDD